MFTEQLVTHRLIGALFFRDRRVTHLELLRVLVRFAIEPRIWPWDPDGFEWLEFQFDFTEWFLRRFRCQGERKERCL